MSETTTRPPGFSTRHASANTFVFAPAEVEHAVRDDHVDGRIGHRKRFDLAEPEFYVVVTPVLGIGSGLVDHLVRHIDANDPTFGSNLRRGEEAVDTCARPEVQHGLPRRQRGDGRRIPAAQTKI